MTTATSTANPTELFRQAIETFESAVKTGVKMQEESTRRFTDMLRDWGSPIEWQKKSQAVMTEAIQVTQKNVEEAVKVMNQNAKTTMELMQKALDARNVSSEADQEARGRELWESALGAMRSGTEAVLQANARVLESWTALAKKVNGQASANGGAYQG